MVVALHGACQARHDVDTLPFCPSTEIKTFHFLFQLFSKPFCAVCPSGCAPAGDSFNSRIMWRENGALMTYMYNPPKVEPCGDNWYWGGKYAVPEQWMFQKTYIKLNDAGVRPSLPSNQIDCICFVEQRWARFVCCLLLAVIQIAEGTCV